MTARIYIPYHIKTLETHRDNARSKGAHSLAIQIDQSIERYKAMQAEGQEYLEIAPVTWQDIYNVTRKETKHA